MIFCRVMCYLTLNSVKEPLVFVLWQTYLRKEYFSGSCVCAWCCIFHPGRFLWVLKFIVLFVALPKNIALGGTNVRSRKRRKEGRRSVRF